MSEYGIADVAFDLTPTQERAEREGWGVHIPSKREVAVAVASALGEAWMDCGNTYHDDGSLAGQTGFAPDFWPEWSSWSDGSTVVLRVGGRTFHLTVSIPKTVARRQRASDKEQQDAEDGTPPKSAE